MMGAAEPDLPVTAVVGAGVAGLATALYLQRSGRRVTVLDMLPPGSGASFGNAGLISKDTAVPVALPGMLQKVPGWLLDAEGPLVVRPRYFPRALPWLLRWVAASRMRRVQEISAAMRALHAGALDCWRELLGAQAYAELIRPVGQVRIWEADATAAAIELELCRRHGVPAQPLEAGDLRRMYPGIADDITQGVLLPGNGYTVNPHRTVRALADQFLAAGGRIAAERVLKLLPAEGGAGYRLLTNVANHRARQVVVAAGAWSRELLDPLGVAVPLETERGYHATMPAPNIELAVPMTVKNRGFGLTSMEQGLRAAGTVEIAGLHAAPDERRASVLVDHARRIFPGLETGEPVLWMGHRPSTPDSLPVAGEVPGQPGLFLAVGHGHFGLTGGPPTGRLVARLMNGEAPGIDARPYSVTRFGSRRGRSAPA